MCSGRGLFCKFTLYGRTEKVSRSHLWLRWNLANASCSSHGFPFLTGRQPLPMDKWSLRCGGLAGEPGMTAPKSCWSVPRSGRWISIPELILQVAKIVRTWTTALTQLSSQMDHGGNSQGRRLRSAVSIRLGVLIVSYSGAHRSDAVGVRELI